MSIWSLCRCTGDLEHPVTVPSPVTAIKSPMPWPMLDGNCETSEGEAGLLQSAQTSMGHSGAALKPDQKRHAPSLPPATAKLNSETHAAALGLPANVTAVTMNGDAPSAKYWQSSADEVDDDSDGELPGFKGRAQIFRKFGNLRDERFAKHLPKGKCVYIQSGDPSDFDGYLIARAGEILSRTTKDLVFVVVVPEERAEDRNEAELDERAEVSMDICGRMLRHLCPGARVVRGPLNQRNIFALMNSPEKYQPAVSTVSNGDDFKVNWTSVKDLVAIVNDPAVTSVMLDLMGSSGFMRPLLANCPDLPKKVINSNFPIPLMCGILAELTPQTLKVGCSTSPLLAESCVTTVLPFWVANYRRSVCLHVGLSWL